LDAPPADNICRLVKAKGVRPSEITALVMDRSRHAEIIAAVRGTGAAVRLISDGDVASVIHTTDPENSGAIFASVRAGARRCTGSGGVVLHRRPNAVPPGA
jgi:fructose-1,6-bisphosphatase/sedoheptulose 1,7-bisphosphatase-like protein